MRKISDKHRQWLLGELPLLESAGVLTPEAAGGLRAYYAANTRSGLHWAVIAFAVLGSLLIGSGIILLFAHNWDAFSRPVRAALSFAPVALGAALSFAALARGGAAWREGAGLFHSLGVGASVALIGQTYHLPSDMPGFLLAWALLILPLALLLRSVGATLIYLALVCGWSGVAQHTYGQAAAFWPLILPPAAWLAHRLRTDRGSPATSALFAGLLLALCVGTGIAFERTVPGLWIVAYAALLSGASLLGLRLYGDAEGWNNIPKAAGVFGTLVLAYLFTWSDMWRNIGWEHLRHDWGFRTWGVWLDGGVTLALLAGWAFSAPHAFRRASAETVALAGFPLIATFGYALASLAERSQALAAMLFNLFLLFLGLMYIALGCRSLRLRQLNLGMATVALLLVTRFFDTDFPYWVRGVVFIVLGAVFLAVNLVMARRKQQKGLAA
jgi:uncharacterized membrane protein